jgi:ATP-dependent DNA helicase RecG
MGLALMRRGEALTNSVYRQVTGLDSRVVTRELGDLVNRGLVEQAGSRRWANYRLAPDQAKEAASMPQTRGRRDRRQDVLNLLRERGELSRAEIARSLDLTDRTANWWLGVLRNEGKVEITTPSLRAPNVRYRLPQVNR